MKLSVSWCLILTKRWLLNGYPNSISDDQQENYILLDVGWEGKKHIHDCIIHVEMKDDKIWIHCDGTEDGVATELMEAGIPKEHIVLAFHHPKERPYTGFAVAWNDGRKAANFEFTRIVGP